MLTTVSPPCSHPIPSPPWHSTFIIKVAYKSAFADYMNHTFCLCVKPLRDIGEKRVILLTVLHFSSWSLLSVPRSWSQNTAVGAMW